MTVVHSAAARRLFDESDTFDREEKDELQVTKGDVRLCFLLDRPNRRMRVIDFRAGMQPNKLEVVQQVAEKEGIERIFTVVEREEASTWTKLGLDKEATIPGFYKRSDGHVLGMVMENRTDFESGTKIRLKAGSPESTLVERVIDSAKRQLKSHKPEQGTPVKIAIARDKEYDKAIAAAEKSDRVLTNFAPFGRDVERRSILCTARGGFSLLVGVETQPCFDNALLEALVAPRGEKEILMTASALGQICQSLTKEGIVSAFALAPAHSVELSMSFLAAGFRATGLLHQHLLIAGKRESATVWARKLAEPA
jgi:hypothetical protein